VKSFLLEDQIHKGVHTDYVDLKGENLVQ
jgi:hypothetical protein